LEMSAEQIGMRFISMASGISYSKQLTGKLRDEEYPTYYQAIEELEWLDTLLLNDLPVISPNKIRQELRRLWPVDLFVVDYLQLLDGDGKFEARHLEVAAIARALKRICREFEIPGMVAAQLSRAGEQRAAGEKRPILSDLGESSELEKVADKVIFIHRPTDTGTLADIIIAKQRNGPTGFCNLDYIGHKTKFESQKGIL
jgi:replicative DNA helicase